MDDLALWQMVASGLFGALSTGIVAVVRGDFLGKAAAKEVEERLTARMDREISAIHEDIKEVKEMIRGLIK